MLPGHALRRPIDQLASSAALINPRYDAGSGQSALGRDEPERRQHRPSGDLPPVDATRVAPPENAQTISYRVHARTREPIAGVPGEPSREELRNEPGSRRPSLTPMSIPHERMYGPPHFRKAWLVWPGRVGVNVSGLMG